MKFFRITTGQLRSTDYRVVFQYAYQNYREIAASTKRRPYIRSKYFENQKIFLGPFWQHTHDKRLYERKERLRYFVCGLELMKKTTYPPVTKENPNNHVELLHRFGGITPQGAMFYVQIKENKRNGQKSLISIFSEKKNEKDPGQGRYINRIRGSHG